MESGNNSKGSNLLSLEGFLAYYRDTAVSSENRVKMHCCYDSLTFVTFGPSHLPLPLRFSRCERISTLSAFRPDLTRRSREHIMYVSGGHEHRYQSVESVSNDVTDQIKRMDRIQLGRLAVLGLESFHLFAYAYSASEMLAQHLLAAGCVRERHRPTCSVALSKRCRLDGQATRHGVLL